jgi:trehalose 2-sulfotransferase
MNSVVVACTLRSGSNLLCELLERFGFGRPTEFFQHERYRNAESLKEIPEAQLATLAQMHAEFAHLHDGLSWRGVKWNWFQFNIFRTAIASQPDLQFEQWLPNAKWIRLTRRNRMSQAVSMYVAKQTGIWVHGDEVAPALKPLEYDFNGIWSEFADFSSEEDLWHAHLKDNRIEHINVVYEDLITDYGNQMRRILSFLGVKPGKLVSATDTLPGDLRNVSIKNPKADEFVEAFRSDLIARRHMADNDSGISLEMVVAALSTPAGASVFSRFVGNDRTPLTIRKLDMKSELQIKGDHAWVTQPHFLDGYALRLNPGSTATVSVRARRLLVEFLSHPWSGTATVTIGGASETLDLFSMVTIRRPWMMEVEKDAELTLTVTSLQAKSQLSDGFEVWIQRIWLLSN